MGGQGAAGADDPAWRIRANVIADFRRTLTLPFVRWARVWDGRPLLRCDMEGSLKKLEGMLKPTSIPCSPPDLWYG
jgi:hypothetical protein